MKVPTVSGEKATICCCLDFRLNPPVTDKVLPLGLVKEPSTETVSKLGLLAPADPPNRNLLTLLVVDSNTPNKRRL